MRRCDYCITAKTKCEKRAILILTTDCEEGNKAMFMLFKKEIEEGKINPAFSLLSPLPDCPHLGKSLKASFSNWYLKLQNERGCLSFLYTLRNKANETEMKIMRNFLTKNDYVRNKDRQDPIAVLKLTNEDLLNHLETLSFVGHTIIPETTKFTEKNKAGMYPNPVSVTVGPFGYLFMSTYESASDVSKVYKIQLHNPV